MSYGTSPSKGYGAHDGSMKRLFRHIGEDVDAVHYGMDDYGLDCVWYGATASTYVWWDESANTWYFGQDDYGTDVYFYGATANHRVYWDETNDTWYFGQDNHGLPVYFYGETTAKLAWWDEANDTWNFGKNDDGVDVYMYGDTASAYLEWDASANALLTAGVARLTLNGVASSGVTDGSVLRMGTSGSPLVDDQAGAGFVVGYFDSGATSGWPVGLFISTNVTGAAGSFTALQGDAVLTAAKATVTGIENFMQVSTGGKVTGACRSVVGTIDFSNEDKGSGGTYSAACFSIKGEGSSVDIGDCQRVSCLELKTEGTFSTAFEGLARGYAIYINGFTPASGGVVNNDSLTWESTIASVIGLRVGVGADAAAGAVYYIPLIPAAQWD